jgi:hypothetical protein
VTKLSDHHSSSIVKLLYIGDSGTGKTGSLTSLVKAGYKLRILDTDNGVDVLKQFVMKECPDKADAVDFEGGLRDKFKPSLTGPVIKGSPKAFVRTHELLDKWTDGSIPSDWGPEIILVLDSLTTTGVSAFLWAQGMSPGAKDPRQWYFAAQGAIERMIDMITSDSFKSNVIVISHINYQESEAGSRKGYASAIGSALGPVLPRYFNNLIMAETTGSGVNVKRKIKTLPTGIVDLKTSAPFKLDKDLPLETGLADIFEKLRS